MCNWKSKFLKLCYILVLKILLIDKEQGVFLTALIRNTTSQMQLRNNSLKQGTVGNPTGSLVPALLILALCQQAAQFLIMKFNFENSLAPYPWIKPKTFNATGRHSAIRLLGPLSINPLVCLTGFMNESSLGQLKWPNFPDPNHKILTEADQGVRHELIVFCKFKE